MAPLTISEADKKVVTQQTILSRDYNLATSLSPEDADAFCSMGVVQGQTEWETFQNEIQIPSKQTNY